MTENIYKTEKYLLKFVIQKAFQFHMTDTIKIDFSERMRV